MAARLARVLRRLDALKDWERAPRVGMADEVTARSCADLLSLLGEPQQRFRHVHVSGSKGKGSTCALVGCALERGGWRTAVLSSPHVESLTERVRIDGQPIGEAPLANALDAALEARAAAEARGSDGGGASWFDVFVAASLLACAEARVGWAVVECGLGGRRDSTNVLGAEVAVLTSVELEHTEVLGDTLEAIAAEKAAIAAEGGALLACVPLRLAPVLHEEARRQRARSVTRLPPSEDRDADNLELARLALDELGRRGAATAAGCDGRPRLGRRLLGPDEVRRARRRLPARYEPLESPCGVAVRLDAAHTAASAAKLVRSIASGGGDEAAKPPVLLVGMPGC